MRPYKFDNVMNPLLSLVLVVSTGRMQCAPTIRSFCFFVVVYFGGFGFFDEFCFCWAGGCKELPCFQVVGGGESFYGF